MLILLSAGHVRELGWEEQPAACSSSTWTKLHRNGWGRVASYLSQADSCFRKLRFLLVLISDWFIPSPVPSPHRKAKACEEQTLETKLQAALDKVNLNFHSTQQHAKGWKKSSNGKWREREKPYAYMQQHLEKQGWKLLWCVMKPNTSGLCYRPEHKHLGKIDSFSHFSVTVWHLVRILQGRAGPAGMFFPAHHPSLAQANTGPTTQIFTWDSGRHRSAMVALMAAGWFWDLTKCPHPIAFCKLSSALGINA